jgi:hypothetical protein
MATRAVALDVLIGVGLISAGVGDHLVLRQWEEYVRTV